MDKAIGLVTAVERHDWKPALGKLLRDSETLMMYLLGRSWAEAEEALRVLSKGSCPKQTEHSRLIGQLFFGGLEALATLVPLTPGLQSFHHVSQLRVDSGKSAWPSTSMGNVEPSVWEGEVTKTLPGILSLSLLRAHHHRTGREDTHVSSWAARPTKHLTNADFEEQC